MASVNVSERDNEAIIKIGQRFDFGAHADFRSAYEACLDRNSIEKFAIDFGDTEYLDSSALGMLLVFRERVDGTKPIRFVNCNKEIKSILDIANFEKLFSIA